MDTNALKKFAQSARRQLIEQVGSRLDHVLRADSVELREKGPIVADLQTKIAKDGREKVIEDAAYIWFNRLCALRYMDVNHYTPVGTVSPQYGFTQPEILQDAKGGVLHDEFPVDRRQALGLLTGITPSNNPEQIVYHDLLIAVCNHYAGQMGFLFEAIEDYTELLMPEDLLSSESILQSIRETLTAEVCQDVEVIGWLYQFYISEKKDEVMGRKGAVPKDDIPAVTQLFTPDWIVRYMVQNSLGRLWLQNHPSSRIQEEMEYYIKSEETGDHLNVITPTELRILDPACGSGHILTYAFDLLYTIYEEQGYDPASIPGMILQHNLYGIEIDERAAQLAGFALMMKAVRIDRRFLTRGIQPNICLMQDVTFTTDEINTYITRLGRDLWTQDLWIGLKQFENAETFGSLIRPEIKDVLTLRQRMQEKGVFDDLLLSATNEKLEKVLQMAEYLSPRYQVVVANPPYFSKGMDITFKKFAKDNYPDSKTDTFAMFTERILEQTEQGGFVGLMTPFVWMFLSSYQKFRNKLITLSTLVSLVRPEYHAFFESAYVPVCSFVVHKNIDPDFKGSFIDLQQFYGADVQGPKTLEAIANPDCGWFYRASAADFQKIPGAPIAYWVSNRVREVFEEGNQLGDLAELQPGLQTSNNAKFIRLWYEIGQHKFDTQSTSNEIALNRKKKWFPYNKGGEYRKWYGNYEYVVNWLNDGKEIKDYVNKKYPYLNGNIDYVIKDRGNFFKKSITWSFVSSSYFGVRYSKPGAIFDVGGSSVFPKDQDIFWLTGFMCSKLSTIFMRAMNPTLNFQVGDVASLPIISIQDKKQASQIASELIAISKSDWDAFETSWNFTENLLIKNQSLPIAIPFTECYQQVRAEWQAMTDEMQRLEEENNHIFIEAYGLQDELTPDVPLEEITLTCNPHYRYKGNLTDAQREARLLKDTVKEFLSYAVGCLFGRYALQKPGLILANQGDGVEAYERILRETPPAEHGSASSPARGGSIGSVGIKITETNLLPILDDEWFTDDLVTRVQAFLRITFGEENYQHNLQFIENALEKTLRRYFLKDFYKDHLKTYKKRPIYWQFSSPKGSFNALIYMHRYESSTVSTVLQYLREYRDKLTGHQKNQQQTADSAGTSQRDKSKALKEVEAIGKVLKELEDYEDNVIYPLAIKNIEIDLDDGVKVNYAKFGKALKKI